MLLAGLIMLAIPAGMLLRILATRPQRGVLVLAALAPFDGLLLLADGPAFLAGWKEALVVSIFGATFLASRRSRPANATAIPAWVGPIAGLVAVATISGLRIDPVVAVIGLKVDYFYLLLAAAIWRCPLNYRERDQLVTILMVAGFITAVVGIGQQLIGERFLNAIGYEFNTVIRTTGDSVLRSFSTFELPFPFAFFVVFVLAIAVPVALQDRVRLRNRLFLWSTPILIAGVATAVVRAAILALTLAAGYLLVRNYRAVLSLTPWMLLVCVIAPATLLQAALSASSLGERVGGWSVVADSIIERPFGTGVGTTGAAAALGEKQGGIIDETFGLPPNLLPYQPDNYYVKRILELGPLGLWLTLAMLRHVIESAHEVRKRAGPSDSALIDGWIASVLGAAVAATVATYWEIFPLDLYFFMLLGVLTSIDRAESPSPDSPSDQTEAAFRPTYANS